MPETTSTLYRTGTPAADVAEQPPEPPESKRRGPYKKKAEAPAPALSGFSAYIAALPDPFRPRHLTDAIRLHAAEHDITGEALAKIDPHRFLKEHGLPNPVKRFRITGEKAGKHVEPAEFDVVDASEGVRQFILLRSIKESHQWRFQSFLLDY